MHRSQKVLEVCCLLLKCKFSEQNPCKAKKIKIAFQSLCVGVCFCLLIQYVYGKSIIKLAFMHTYFIFNYIQNECIKDKIYIVPMKLKNDPLGYSLEFMIFASKG